MSHVPPGHATVTPHLIVERAIEAGAEEERPVADQFYGDRAGTLVDPFGHRWTLAIHKEDVGEAELKRRLAEMSGG